LEKQPVRLLVVLALFLVSVPWNATAGIYGYMDDGGSYHFTNIKPSNKQYYVLIETKEPSRGPAHGTHGPGQNHRRPWRDDEERHSLIKQARTFLGVPYKLGGEGMSGIDCSAFVKKIFSSIDVALPRTAREQYDAGRKISKSELTTGDLVFFTTKKYEQYPTHVGIFIGNDQFIHASALKKGGVKIDSLSSDFYNARFIGGTRVMPLPEEG
jgi:hypothetical protein